MEGRPPGERDLVVRAQRGDEHAFAALVRDHEQTAFRLAYVITGNAADAEAAQEAFAKAWQALPRFRSGEPLRPWLLRIVANEARERLLAALRLRGGTVKSRTARALARLEELVG